MRCTLQCELQLDHACERLRLARGSLIRCLQGSVWLTQDTPRQRGPSPDLVLQAGQQHAVAEDGDYFLTHLRPAGPARCTVEQPVRARGLRPAGVRWVFSPG